MFLVDQLVGTFDMTKIVSVVRRGEGARDGRAETPVGSSAASTIDQCEFAKRVQS
jgi:hypothetical protein